MSSWQAIGGVQWVQPLKHISQRELVGVSSFLNSFHPKLFKGRGYLAAILQVHSAVTASEANNSVVTKKRGVVSCQMKGYVTLIPRLSKIIECPLQSICLITELVKESWVLYSNIIKWTAGRASRIPLTCSFVLVFTYQVREKVGLSNTIYIC
jgi:hypothetical protein